MSLFNKLDNAIFLKEDSDAEEQLNALELLVGNTTGETLEAIQEQIRLLKAGIYGEKNVKFELENSHIPMYVLHDLFLEHEGLSSQIDYLLITRKFQFILECKNLYGDIEINNNGDFIRTFQYGTKKKREGIYSPITQNRRHLELIKKMRSAEKMFLLRGAFEKGFDDFYKSIVVLTNPKTILNARYAKKEVRDQVIRADQLSEYIRVMEKNSKTIPSSDAEMKELAEFFLSRHVPQAKDYTERFRQMSISDQDQSRNLRTPVSEASEKAIAQNQNENKTNSGTVACPKCGAPMVLRTAQKGNNAGKQFYGCSMYPRCKGIVNVML